MPEENYTAIAKHLIEKGADVNLGDNQGMTALMHASENRNLDVVEYLIKYGADVNLKNNQNLTALRIVCLDGYSEFGDKVVKLLREAGATF
ncbi:MAG: ankyrin repeat domain-containing protein [Alphaproteobacteria bacterium]|nr:MAG: ankyrin repeat domain-containing protein [Alphaproteobacteria bacterium]